VAVNVQLTNNCLLYLNRTALSAQTLHRWTPLTATVPVLWTIPLPLLYYYQNKYLLYLKWTALSDHSLNRRTPLSASVHLLWSRPSTLLYNYQPTACPISKELHYPPTHYSDEHREEHQYLNCVPARWRYFTTTYLMRAVSQQNSTIRTHTTQMNTVNFTSTWLLILPVAVTVLQPTNCLLYLNRTALSAHSLHRCTPLSAPVSRNWSSPLPFFYNYQRTACCFTTELHSAPSHYTVAQR